jgi:hypothetical protein
MINCTLSILVARPDVGFMMHTIPHLVKTCQFNFAERMLVMDTAPLSQEYQTRPGVGTQQELRDCCQALIAQGVIDKVIEIDYSAEEHKRVYTKHFGRIFMATHDFRGYPILGSLFAIEAAAGDYVLHFDSDMLLHQKPEHNWIQEGIDLLQKQPEVMFVSPLSGPPTHDGSLHQRVSYERSAGFYRFQDFTSRKFLVDRNRLTTILPLKPMWISWKRQLLSYFTRKSAMWSWEVMISNRLRETGYIRADLSSPKAWTLHTPDHGEDFIRSLPTVIKSVEAGNYPPAQAGDYDLHLSDWINDG